MAYLLKRFRIDGMDKRTISDVMRAMGSKGGKIGGKRSLETMTPEERTARAKVAASASAKARSPMRRRKPETEKQDVRP